MDRHREVITLQIGNVANFVGSHFWNLQESSFDLTFDGQKSEDLLYHSCLYRSGELIDGSPTYLPRCVVVDEASNFNGSINIENSVLQYSQQEDTWNLGATVYEKLAKSLVDPAQLQASGNAEFWGDFLWTTFHAKSVTPVESTCDWAFSGAEEYRALEERLLDDKIRYFAEECDRLQGFNLMADLCSGLGAFAGCLASSIRDEYPRQTLLTFGCEEFSAGKNCDGKDVIDRQAVNMSLASNHLLESSSLFIPVRIPSTAEAFPQDFPGDPASLWQCTALAAAAVDSLLLPARLKSEPHYTLYDLADRLGSPVPVAQLWQQFGSSELVALNGKKGEKSVPTLWDFMANKNFKNLATTGAVGVSRNSIRCEDLGVWLNRIESCSYRDVRGTLAVSTSLPITRGPTFPSFGSSLASIPNLVGIVSQPEIVRAKLESLNTQLKAAKPQTRKILEANGVLYDDIEQAIDANRTLIETL